MSATLDHTSQHRDDLFSSSRKYYCLWQICSVFAGLLLLSLTGFYGVRSSASGSPPWFFWITDQDAKRWVGIASPSLLSLLRTNRVEAHESGPGTGMVGYTFPKRSRSSLITSLSLPCFLVSGGLSVLPFLIHWELFHILPLNSSF